MTNFLWFFFFLAADRATTDSIADAKEGLVVSCVDTIETYRTHVSRFLTLKKMKLHFSFFLGKHVYTYGAFDISFVEINASIRFGIVEIRRIPERRKS